MMRALRAMCFLCAVVMVLGFEECTVNCTYCTNITLVDQEQVIYMECFPAATGNVWTCGFAIKKGSEFDYFEFIDVEYDKENRTKCVFKMPLQEFDGEGEYRIHVGVADMMTMLYTKLIYSMTLSSPTAKIEACGPQTDVKNNFVKYGANISCECTSDDDVLPRGTANWYQGNKKLDTTHTENGTRSTLILTSVTEDPSQNYYTCVAESAIGNHSELLNLTLAKSPSQVEVFGNYSQDGFLNYHEHPPTVVIKCATLVEDVYPLPKLTFTQTYNSKQPSVPKKMVCPEIKIDSDYKDGPLAFCEQIFSYFPEEGTYTITCTAVNPMFDDLFTSKELNLVVRGFSGSGHEVYDMALVMICCMVTIFGLLT